MRVQWANTVVTPPKKQKKNTLTLRILLPPCCGANSLVEIGEDGAVSVGGLVEPAIILSNSESTTQRFQTIQLHPSECLDNIMQQRRSAAPSQAQVGKRAGFATRSRDVGISVCV